MTDSVVTSIRGSAIATLAIVGALASGCDDGTTSAGSSDPAAKYEQTWPKQYDRTTCRQWINRMSPQQRSAAAADMLTGARNKGDGGQGVPSDSLINAFKRDVDDSCVIPRAKLAEIGAGVYLTERSKYRP